MVEAHVGIRVAGQTAIALGLFLHRALIAGVGPPLVRRLTRRRDHAGQEDQHIDGQPIGDQRGGERTERVAHDDQVLPLTGSLDHGVGIVHEGLRLVITRKVGRQHVVPTRS